MAVDSTGTVWGMPIYDSPDHIDRADSFVPYSLVSYDGREWRGYQAPLGKPIGWYSVGMLVDPGGTLWISTPYLLAHQTASGWMEYEYSSFYGFGKPAMAAERAGRIWIDGGGWIGVFESGQLHRTPSGSNPDIFVGPVNQARKLYYDGEWLWIANQSLARWRLSQRATSVEDEPGPESSGQSRLMDSYPNPFNARTTHRLRAGSPSAGVAARPQSHRSTGDDAGGGRLPRRGRSPSPGTAATIKAARWPAACTCAGCGWPSRPFPIP